MNADSILLFKTGYIDRCKNVEHYYINDSFIVIANEHELYHKLSNNEYPTWGFGEIVYNYNHKYSKQLLKKLFKM